MDKTIIIEVSGGLAYCTHQPDDVNVVIWDWDNYNATNDPADYAPDCSPNVEHVSPIVVAYLHAAQYLV